jgi:hypothetical protein
MGIVNGIILVAAGGYIPKGAGIDQLPAPERGPENLTITLTTVNTPGTKPAARYHAAGTVPRAGSIITIWSL